MATEPASPSAPAPAPDIPALLSAIAASEGADVRLDSLVALAMFVDTATSDEARVLCE